MKLFNLFPIAFAYPDRTQVDNKLSCSSGKCNQTSLGLFDDVPPMVLNENSRASCEQQVIEDRIFVCEKYDAEQSECAQYINDEMVRTCRDSYNCIVTSKYGDWASWRTYEAKGDRKNMKNNYT